LYSKFWSALQDLVNEASFRQSNCFKQKLRCANANIYANYRFKKSLSWLTVITVPQRISHQRQVLEVEDLANPLDSLVI
jgi:hypothetical protein